MKADEIHDLESFENWVAAGPSVVNDTAFVQIALRASLRTFPLFASQIGANWMAEWNVSSLPTLRYALTIGVSQHFGREEFAVTLVKAQIAVHRDATSASNANDFGPSLGDTTAASTFINGFSLASYVQRAPIVASNADVAAELVSGSTGQIWSTVARDAKRAEVGTALLYAPLWLSDRPDWFTAADTRAREIWSRDPETWDFWLRWWDGVISGNQLDWDLQKAVALEIPEEAWSDPKTVAAHIRLIEEREGLRRENARLKAMLVDAKLSTTAGAEQRGHNNPPELIDLPTEVQSALSEIGEQLDIAATELEAPRQSSARLTKVGAVLKASAKVVLAYVGRKLDALTDATVKSIGAVVGPSLFAWLSGVNWEHFIAFGDWLEKFATKLP